VHVHTKPEESLENTPITHKNNNLLKIKRIPSGGPFFCIQLARVWFGPHPVHPSVTSLKSSESAVSHAALYCVKRIMSKSEAVLPQA